MAALITFLLCALDKSVVTSVGQTENRNTLFYLQWILGM